MSIQSNATTDLVQSPSITGPTGAWFAAFLYKAAHDPGTGTESAIFSWENSGATYRQRQNWDSTSGQRGQFINLTGGGYSVKNSLPISGYGTTTYHSIVVGYDGSNNVTYLDGVLQNRLAAAGPASGSAPINLLGDPYYTGTVSPLGAWSQFAVWQGRAPQDAEVLYLAVGGTPSYLSSTSPNALTEYLPLTSNTTDLGPHAYTQTTTGSPSFIADPPFLLGALPAMQTTDQYIMSCFRGPEASGTSDFHLYLFNNTDATGVAYQYRPVYCVPPGGNVIHDPAVFQVNGASGNGAAMNNKFLMSCINVNGGNESTWDLYVWDGDVSGNRFDYLTSPDCSAITGGGANARVFGPQYFQDVDGSPHIIVGLSNDAYTTMQQYEMHPTNSAWTTWSTPVAITGTALPARMYDANLVLKGGSYYLWYTDGSSGSNYICYATSSSPFSGYTVTKSGNWASWGGNLEGVSVCQKANGDWLVFVDYGLGHGLKYSLSTDNWATWSALADCTINGSGTTSGPFVPQGATVIRVTAPIVTATGFTSVGMRVGSML